MENLSLTSSLAAQGASSIPPAKQAKMREAAENFESFFIAQFINLMKPENLSEQFNGGEGERIFRTELNNALAKNITKNGGFGIADNVYSALLKQQEGRYE